MSDYVNHLFFKLINRIIRSIFKFVTYPIHLIIYFLNLLIQLSDLFINSKPIHIYF